MLAHTSSLIFCLILYNFFVHIIGRHSSMPASGNQHLALDRRAHTCPSKMREAISQPTLHRLQPPTGAHPKAVHQSSNQMQASASTLSSMHYHNPLVSEQESIRASSTPSQDSGVEMVHWTSASQDNEQFEQSWVQQRPRVTSISTAVQTEHEGEDGLEKTALAAALNPRVDGMYSSMSKTCHIIVCSMSSFCPCPFTPTA